MGILRTIGSALLALATATAASGQPLAERVSLNAAVGPSFATLGTTFSTLADMSVRVSDRAVVTGEFGLLPHAPFDEAARVAAPSLLPTTGTRVNAYHWNGNLRYRPFEIGKWQPYVTGGFGVFSTDTLGQRVDLGGTTVQDRRRVSDLATNVGAGVRYALNDWLGVSADYRTFFVHRDDDTPRVNRFTTGLTFSLK